MRKIRSRAPAPEMRDSVIVDGQLFRTLADHAPSMLWMTDASGRLITKPLAAIPRNAA